MFLLLSYEIDMWFLRQLMEIQVVMHNGKSFLRRYWTEIHQWENPITTYCHPVQEIKSISTEPTSLEEVKQACFSR